MHKKHKSHKLHSIPISSLCRNNYLVSYSIPLSCMVALLLLGLIIINPSNTLKTNAVTIQDEWVVTDNTSEDEEKLNNILNDSSEDSADEEFGGFGGDNVELSQSDQDAGISPMSITTNPTISLTIGKTTIETSTVQGGNTAYATNTVTLTGSYVKDYTLSIKSASANLSMPTGADSSTSTISAVGTTGVLGSNMSDNKWGYAVTESSTTNYAGLTYKTTPTTATTIASGAGNTESSTSMNISKQLVFAAKFGSDATPGTYSASITLSATATPKALTMANITDMQDMTPEICTASSLGQTATLKDSRDTNSYTIVKLKDNHCWMQQNLRLGGTSQIKLTPSDSNVANDYNLPASSDSSWKTSETTGNGQIRVGKAGMTVSDGNAGDGKGWQSNYGNYYSWCAATAGTCGETTSNNVNVSGSICPKNWHLPSGGSTNATTSGVGTDSEFYKLLNGLNMSTITASPYLFPAAGRISSNGLSDPGTSGRYWSRTSDGGSYAYLMSFQSTMSNPGTSSSTRYGGYPIRCVADY